VLVEAHVLVMARIRNWARSGLAAGSVNINRNEPTVIFARIFNRPTAGGIHVLCGQSAVHQFNHGLCDFHDCGVSPTDQAVDGGDDDADGLNNSWERSLGSDDRAIRTAMGTASATATNSVRAPD
jgi:hypothetical protein